MPYKQTTTQCIVRLVTLRGLDADHARPVPGVACERLDASGRIWWLCTPKYAPRDTGSQQESWSRRPRVGSTALHSQSVQALCQKLAANVATVTELRRQEMVETGQRPDAVSASPQSLPDGGLEGPGAANPAHWTVAPAHGRAATAAAAAVAGGISAAPTYVGPS